MSKHDPSKASEKTCRELAEAASAQHGNLTIDGLLLVAKYRAECAVAPLRTRTERDAQLVREVAAVSDLLAEAGFRYLDEPVREPTPAPSIRLTEAEAALLEWAAGGAREWRSGDVYDCRGKAMTLMNAVRDERRAAPAKADEPSAAEQASRENERLRGLLRRVRVIMRNEKQDTDFNRIEEIRDIIQEAGEL